jgi:hypothetical protein
MKRPEHIIEDLITRQLDGTPLTDTERRELQEWLEASEANRDAFLRAYKAWGNARLAETRFNTGQALENVMARIAEASRPRSFLRPQLRRLGIGIAAAACVMLAVVGYYRLQPSTVPDIEMFIRQADTPVFTQKEVQLVLSEQKTLLLETQKSTIRYDSTAIRINNAEKTQYYAEHIGIVDIEKNFGAPIHEGDRDKARIMVAIVDWNTRREVGSGTEAPTGTWDPEETTSVDEGPIIAYGSLFIDQSSTGGKMIDVQLPLNYYDTKTKPSGLYQIVISCSTSAYGDFMAGCKSNILYVDNFEWVY